MKVGTRWVDENTLWTTEKGALVYLFVSLLHLQSHQTQCLQEQLTTRSIIHLQMLRRL